MVEIYRIHVSGRLENRWSDWFGGMALERQDDGTTVLVGSVVDQAELHGVIARIRDLGLPLVSVSRVVNEKECTLREFEVGDVTASSGGGD